jgi:flagellar biosynthesis protein FlhF
MSMKLLTFRAATMPKALVQVKRELGSNAVIVQTRTLSQGGFMGLGKRQAVEIVARKNQNNSSPRKKSVMRSDKLRQHYAKASDVSATIATPPINRIKKYNRESLPTKEIARLPEDFKKDMANIKEMVERLVKQQRQSRSPNMPDQLFDIYVNLIQQEVTDELARELMANVQKDLSGSQMENPFLISRKLSEMMESTIRTVGPIACNLNGSPRTVALVGPTGVGKTTTVAKLAANFKLKENKKVGLITIDTYRIGAVDQLRMYAQIIDVPLKVVLTPQDLREAIATMDDMDMIFIDTAGRSQNDELKIQELQSFLSLVNPDEIHLVLSTTGHQANLISAAEKFKKVGSDRVIFTKLDEAISLGVIFSVLRKIDVSLSYLTTGQDVPADIEIASPGKLVNRILRTETKDCSKKTFAEFTV